MLKKGAVYGARIVAGLTFILSGFTKSVDPWGTVYKFNDYLSAMHLEVWPNLVLTGAFSLGIFEFVLGVLLLTGSFRRSSAWLLAATMCIMLPLTVWIAVADPVADCGCFGDAVKLSNGMTLFKNVILCVCALLLVARNKRCHWVVTPALQWLGALASAVYITAIALVGYNAQPLVDFRPYKTGSLLVDADKEDGAGPDYIFIYEKEGQRKEFNENDELPGEDWTFVERRVNGDNEDAVKDFRIYDAEEGEDVTDGVILKKGKQILLAIPDIENISPATTWKLNSLSSWAQRHGVVMTGVVAGSDDKIAEWKDISMSDYPVYTADDTTVKSLVRGNPGVVYLVDGMIVWKSTLSALDTDDFLSPEMGDEASAFVADRSPLLLNCTLLYVAVMAALVFLSFTPWLKNLYFHRNHS